MMIHLVPEVNRAFSAGGLFLSYKSWGAATANPSYGGLTMRLRPWHDRHPGALAEVRRSISFATGRVRPNGRRVACEFKLNCSGRRAACEFVCSPHGCLYKRSDENAFCL